MIDEKRKELKQDYLDLIQDIVNTLEGILGPEKKIKLLVDFDCMKAHDSEEE